MSQCIVGHLPYSHILYLLLNFVFLKNRKQISDIRDMRPKGTAEQLEYRRRLAISLLQKGLGVREVARLLDASSGSVSRWKEAYRRGGEEGLRAKPHPGARKKLSQEEREKLEELLLQGPTSHGYKTDLWTLKRVAEVIERNFGVRYHPSHVWRILQGMGWSCQEPDRRARERDEEEIEKWGEESWPHIKKVSGGGA